MHLVYLALIINLICPLPPPNSIESPKIFQSKHYLTMGNESAAFNLLNYKNNSEQAIQATYHVRVGGQCMEYKTGVLKAGQKVGGNNSILFYKRFDEGGEGYVKIYVELIN